MNADQTENQDNHNTHAWYLTSSFFRSAFIRVDPR